MVYEEDSPEIDNSFNQSHKMIEKVNPQQVGIIEKEVCKLPDVKAARLITDILGRPKELHIVANTSKTAKQVAKDVHSVLLATFSLSIDHRIISVVQIISDNNQSEELSENVNFNSSFSRPKIDKVIVEKNDKYAVARVSLNQGSNFFEGFAQGSVSALSRNRLIAQATLDSLKQINDLDADIDVVSAECISNNDYQIALVAIVLIENGNEESLAGSAIVKENDTALAIAKAVLSATNRRLALINN